MAGERYALTHQTAAGTTLAMCNITGSATLVLSLYDVVIGSDATPADQANEFVIDRTTTAGVGTTTVQVPLDPAGIASRADSQGGTYGTDPVRTASTGLLMIGLNQRATFRWVAAPGGEIKSVAAAVSGLEIFCVTATATPNMNFSMHWME